MTVDRFSPRLLHTMLHVQNLHAMLEFYCERLGMQEIRRIEFAERRYTLVFVGYPDESQGPQIEEFCAELRRHGVSIVREPAAMRTGGRVIALVRDPEGHEVELLAND
jgi:lactoylglutathione lyase